MGLRPRLLRVMLWSLGAAAVLGALSVLFLRSQVVSRVVGSAAVAGVGAGLMILMTFVSDRPKARNAGLLGMAFVLAEAVMTLALIWTADTPLEGDWMGSVGLTMLFLSFTAPPAMLMVRGIETEAGRRAGIAGTVLCAAVFVLLLYPSWFDNSWDRWEEYVGTAGAVAAFGLLACACLVGTSPARRGWRWAGVGAAVLAGAMAVYGIWRSTGRGEEVFAVVTTAAILLAHANLVLLVPLAANQRRLARATVAAAVACGVLLDIDIVTRIRDGGLTERGAAASGILAACGTLALAVLARMNRKAERPAVALAHVTTFALVCPGCQRRQTLPTGTGRCPTCGVIVHCRFEEPRCPRCDYNLFQLRSDRCPECGLEVSSPATSPPPLPNGA